MIADKPVLNSFPVRIDKDSPWKHALDLYFRGFMEYCLPDIAEHLDWSRGYEPLDKELQKIARQAKTGKRTADKLIKIELKSGGEAWVLCHIEVQGQRKKNFPERMLVYRYRIRDYYQKPIISVALLIDDNPNWRPDSFQESYFGTSLEVRYRVIKLLDYQTRIEELKTIKNPFATALLAQLTVLQTYKNPEARLKAKTALVRQLYAAGWEKEQILSLYSLIDWLIVLPEELMVQYQEAIKEFEEKKDMGYVSTAELVAIKKGMQEGMEKGILQGMEKGILQGMEKGILQGMEKGMRQGEITLLIRLLERRFGSIPDQYLQLMQQADNNTLLLWGERILTAATLQEVFR